MIHVTQLQAAVLKTAFRLDFRAIFVQKSQLQVDQKVLTITMPNISPPKFSWIRIIGMGCKGMVCCLHSCIDQGSTFICSFLIFFSGCLSFIGTPGKNVACKRSRKNEAVSFTRVSVPSGNLLTLVFVVKH